MAILTPKRGKLLSSLALTYLFVRFFLTLQLDALSSFAAYVFEVACVLAALLLFGRQTLSYLSTPKESVLASAFALFIGFGIFKLAGIVGIVIPFTMTDSSTILMLLMVAPVLEEALFRFLIWQSALHVGFRPRITLVLTSAIFSYAHFHAVWFVSPDVIPFVYFQTGYTFFLGLACGLFVLRYASLAGAMLVHFGFNLGFFLASQV